jgi:hypothetical protein
MPAVNRRKREPALTARDAAAMAWIGEQYAARFDVVTVLLSRWSPVPGRRPTLLSRRAVRDVLRRWELAKLARVESALGALWVTPTERGLRFGELDYDTWPLRGRLLQHVHAAGVVRLHVEAQGGVWQGDRSLRQERKHNGGKWRAPDAVVTVPQPDGAVERFEIEVELSQKSHDNLLDALSMRTTQGAKVVYYSPAGLVERMRSWVLRGLAELQADPTRALFAPSSIQVLPLPEVPGTTYAGRW